MKSIPLFLGLTSLLLIQGCSSNSEESDEVPAPPPITFDNEPKKQEAKPTPVHETPHRNVKPDFPPVAPMSVLINGMKMQPSELPVIRGTRIFIPNVNQYAVASGDIVVVSKNANLPDELKATYQVSPIVTNTFRLVPKKEDENLLEHYNTLQKIEAIQRVELSIVYEGINNTPIEIK